MEDELARSVVKQFSDSLWNTANAVTLSMIGMTFGVYAVVLTSDNFQNISKKIIEPYYWLIISFAIIGNISIVYGLFKIGKNHNELISRHCPNVNLEDIISKSTRFRIMAIGLNLAMYLVIVSVIKWDCK